MSSEIFVRDNINSFIKKIDSEFIIFNKEDEFTLNRTKNITDANLCIPKTTDDNLNKILVLITLFLVALSILYLLYILYNVNETKYKFNKELGFYGMLYFFIHCFFLDFITWSYNFF